MVYVQKKGRAQRLNSHRQDISLGSLQTGNERIETEVVRALS